MCEGQHKPAHKRAHEYFPQPIQSPPIHAVSDSRSITHWRDLANWLHLSFPRVKIGTEGGWCCLFSLALHFTHARHQRCHSTTGKGCKQELQSSLTLHISYLSPFLAKQSSKGSSPCLHSSVSPPQLLLSSSCLRNLPWAKGFTAAAMGKQNKKDDHKLEFDYLGEKKHFKTIISPT